MGWKAGSISSQKHTDPPFLSILPSNPSFQMSAAVDRASTPVVTIPPVDIDLTQDWGDAGPPPPRAPRLQRHNAMAPSESDDVEIMDVTPRSLFQTATTAPLTEHVAGLHFHDPVINMIHFDPGTCDELYDIAHTWFSSPYYSFTQEAVVDLFTTAIEVWTTSSPLKRYNKIYAVRVTGECKWRFQSFHASAPVPAGAIPIHDLPLDVVAEYMACDYIRQTFVNLRYLRSYRSPTVAEVNSVLERQCALHVQLVGFVVK